MEPTTTDVGASDWRVDDEPFRFRQWGTDIVYLFPERSKRITIGKDATCEVRLFDKHVSGRHAVLAHDGSRWVLNDEGSKNKLVVDGIPQNALALAAGLVFKIGGVVLVVESRRLIELRSFLGRLLGYGADRLAGVDRAMRSLRRAAAHQAPLVLHGDGDLIAIARDLHRRCIGDDKPFVVCDPRRGRHEATVRSAENFPLAEPAMRAAIGGSLCVWSKRVPRDFGVVSLAHREPDARFQLVMCGREPADIRPNQTPPIVIEALSARERELPRVVDEYANDARAALTISTPLSLADREWIVQNSASTLAEIEKGTRRIIALRATGENTTAAATMLGMQATSLMRWLHERKPLPIADRTR